MAMKLYGQESPLLHYCGLTQRTAVSPWPWLAHERIIIIIRIRFSFET